MSRMCFQCRPGTRLDITPKGRNETGPNHNLSDWVRHHDRYDAKGHVDATGAFIADKPKSSCHSE